MVDINREGLDDFFRGLQVSFRNGFATEMPFAYERLCTMVKSTTAAEDYTWLGEADEMREWLGERVIRQLASHDYSIKNRKFELTLKAKKDDLEDDKIGAYSTRAEAMGNACKLQPARLVAEILQGKDKDGNALPSKLLKCYDEQNFFDDEHPVGKDGNISLVSNDRGGTARPYFYMLDLSRPLKPLIFQRRKELDFVSKTDTTSDHVFKYDEYLYGASVRNACGFGLWQCAMRSAAGTTGATNAALLSLATEVEAMAVAMRAYRSDEGRLLGINPRVIVCDPSAENDFRRMLSTANIPIGEAASPNHVRVNVNYNAFELIVVPFLSNVAPT